MNERKNEPQQCELLTVVFVQIRPEDCFPILLVEVRVEKVCGVTGGNIIAVKIENFFE